MIKVMELFIGICTLRSKNDQVGDRIGRDKTFDSSFYDVFLWE